MLHENSWSMTQRPQTWKESAYRTLTLSHKKLKGNY